MKWCCEEEKGWLGKIPLLPHPSPAAGEGDAAAMKQGSLGFSPHS